MTQVMADCLSQYGLAGSDLSGYYGVGVFVNYGHYDEGTSGVSGASLGVSGGSFGAFLIGPGYDECLPDGGRTQGGGTANFSESDVARQMGSGFGLSHSHRLDVGQTPVASSVYAQNWNDEYGNGYGSFGGGDYGDTWDLMSCMMCSSLGDAKYSEVGPGLNAGHLMELRWFDYGNRYTYLGGGTTKSVLLVPISYRSSNPDAGATLGSSRYQFARIPVHGSLQHYYSAELRTSIGYDRGLAVDAMPAAAVVIHEVDAVNETVLKTKPDGSGTFMAGDSFTDSVAAVTIDVVSIENAADPNATTATIQITSGP
jgi:hypothetical protein